MLAYVFWHWRKRGVSADDYEARQREFHASLHRAPIAGFSRSASFATSVVPIPGEASEVYEDWYSVDDFAALGTINDAAVSAERAAPHAAAAALADNGAGGIYRLKQGSFVTGAKHAAWFSKPSGMRYEALFEELAPRVESANGALWMRQMVLGPGREFCLQSAEPIDLPEAYASLAVKLRGVWP
jgi:hypothetical protein